MSTPNAEMKFLHQILVYLKSEAPDNEAVEKCDEIYRHLIKSDLTNEDLITKLLSIVLDGQRYGNWPWTKSLTTKDF